MDVVACVVARHHPPTHHHTRRYGQIIEAIALEDNENKVCKEEL